MAHGADGRFVVFVEVQHHRSPQEFIPEIQTWHTVGTQSVVCGNDLCLRGGMRHTPLFLALSGKREDRVRPEQAKVDARRGSAELWVARKVSVREKVR